MNCIQCTTALVQRNTERPGRFKARKYCSSGCAADHRGYQQNLRTGNLKLDRLCAACATPLRRNRRAGGLVENTYQFAARKTCNNQCAAVMRSKKAAKKSLRPAPVVFFPVTLDPLIECWNQAIIRSRAN
jgi:hypothetical protein